MKFKCLHCCQGPLPNKQSKMLPICTVKTWRILPGRFFPSSPTWPKNGKKKRPTLSRLSGVCQEYVRSMSGICREYVWGMSGICRAYVGSMSGVCREYVGSMSGSMSGVCLAYVGNMSGVCREYVGSMSGVCQKSGLRFFCVRLYRILQKT